MLVFLNKLTKILSNFENIFEHNFIFASDFSSFLYYLLDAKAGTPVLKSWYIKKLMGLKKT